MDQIEIAIAGLTNLDLLEIRNSLPPEMASADSMSVSKVGLDGTRYGDPAMVTALIKVAIDVAPTVLPILAGALAAWIAKGKKAGRLRGKNFSLSRNGIQYSSFEADSFEESDASAILPKLQATFQPKPA